MTFPWDKVDYLVLNEQEAQSLANSFSYTTSEDYQVDVQEPAQVCDFVASPRLRNTTVIITQGSRGVDLWNTAMVPACIHIVLPESLEIKVQDTTGAGDCFTVGLSHIVLCDLFGLLIICDPL